ncbi:MAG TPA: putative LPS assembly protein LptD, partial [Gemmatimonadaceae bacterium]|nr:putative LPS assembly protein LptD [Gemmatimonadaceae bacterium]
MRHWHGVLLCLGAAGAAAAQGAVGVPTPPASVRARPDSAHRDTLARTDTTRRDTALVHFAPPDSITRALMSRPGYDKDNAVRYQSDTAIFDIRRSELTLLPDSGRRAFVQMGSRLVVSDSGIDYRERDSLATFGGNYILHDPKSGQADVHGSAGGSYDLRSGSAFLSNADFKYNAAGSDWFVKAAIVRMTGDSTKPAGQTFYSGPGTLTSCDDSIPDYHFAYGEAKRTSDKTMLVRPAILYISDIPVMWFPFMFETKQGGRTSGVLTPQFSVNDIVRTSPAYHRSVNNVGYYYAMNDYSDVEAWLDWRSSSGANSDVDPGYITYNGVWNYNWLNEFMVGNAGASYTQEGGGETNLHLSLNHSEQFSHNGHLTATINYVTNTTIQRQNSFDPVAALATIQSQVSYSRQFGTFTVALGGTRTQHPGRQEVDQGFPSLQVSTPEIALASWLAWTPSFSFSSSQALHIDQPGTFTYRYGIDSAGARDSVPLDRNQHTAALSFATPVKIFGQDLGNSFSVNSTENDYPEQFTLYDVVTGDSIGTRVYAKTFQETIDWTPQYTLPPLSRSLFNISPTVSFANVDGGPFWVKTERTNGQFVHQSKRPTFGLSASPTIFGLFPGFGQTFLGFRHSIAPTISYTYAPASSVPDQYLAATGRSRNGYLGALAENQLSLGLNQSLEAKIRTPGDTDQSKAQKIKIITLNVTSLAYDFTRLHSPEITNTHWWRALTTQNFGYTVTSDLLPGINFSTDYSLFQGSTSSDTAVFRPFLDNVSASM